jgi:hypothetical protein
VKTISAGRKRLAKQIELVFLSELDMKITVDPSDIEPAVGHQRTSNSMCNDTWRWEAYAMWQDNKTLNGIRLRIGSYTTMRDCNKGELCLLKHDNTMYEIFTKD